MNVQRKLVSVFLTLGTLGGHSKENQGDPNLPIDTRLPTTTGRGSAQCPKVVNSVETLGIVEFESGTIFLLP